MQESFKNTTKIYFQFSSYKELNLTFFMFLLISAPCTNLYLRLKILLKRQTTSIHLLD